MVFDFIWKFTLKIFEINSDEEAVDGKYSAREKLAEELKKAKKLLREEKKESSEKLKEKMKKEKKKEEKKEKKEKKDEKKERSHRRQRSLSLTDTPMPLLAEDSKSIKKELKELRSSYQVCPCLHSIKRTVAL